MSAASGTVCGCRRMRASTVAVTPTRRVAGRATCVVATGPSGPAPVTSLRTWSEPPRSTCSFYVARVPGRGSERWRCGSPPCADGVVEAGVLARVEWRSRTRARSRAMPAPSLSRLGARDVFVARSGAPSVFGIRQQVWIDGHPVDFLIGDRLVVQIDGFEHHSSRGGSSSRHRMRDARLDLLGYTVLRFDYQQVIVRVGCGVESGASLTAIAQRAPSRRSAPSVGDGGPTDRTIAARSS